MILVLRSDFTIGISSYLLKNDGTASDQSTILFDNHDSIINYINNTKQIDEVLFLGFHKDFKVIEKYLKKHKTGVEVTWQLS